MLKILFMNILSFIHIDEFNPFILKTNILNLELGIGNSDIFILLFSLL
jgi:hypothetical protein